MRAASIIVLTVHDLGLLRMKLQVAFRQTLPNCRQQFLSLREAASMHDRIVGVACELNVWEITPQPFIERITPTCRDDTRTSLRGSEVRRPVRASSSRPFERSDLVPWLHAHYRRFTATTDQSAPVPRIGTQVLVGLPLGRLP